jgi:hypothetical protein
MATEPPYGGGCNTAKAIMQGSRNRVKNISESSYSSQDVLPYSGSVFWNEFSSFGEDRIS